MNDASKLDISENRIIEKEEVNISRTQGVFQLTIFINNKHRTYIKINFGWEFNTIKFICLDIIDQATTNIDSIWKVSRKGQLNNPNVNRNVQFFSGPSIDIVMKTFSVISQASWNTK